MLIFLIGMPGAGKTTLGSALAKALGFGFVDLDEQLERAENQPIAQIFQEKGESYFRELEARELRSLPGEQNTVVATGGGTPCFYENMAWINENGLSIYLEVPLEVLVQRLQSQTHRPLLAGKTQPLIQKLHETFRARKRYYEQAAVIVAAAEMTATSLAQLVRTN